MYLYKINQDVDGNQDDDDAILLMHASPFTEDEFSRMFERVAVLAMERAANKNPSILPRCYAQHWFPEAAKLMCERFGFTIPQIHAVKSVYSGRLDMGHDSGMYDDEATRRLVQRAEEYGPVEHPKVVAERESRRRQAMINAGQVPPPEMDKQDARKAIDALVAQQIMSESFSMDLLNPLKPVDTPKPTLTKAVMEDVAARNISLPLYYRGPAVTGIIL